MKKLIILDLNENFEILRENCDIIFLNKGTVNLKNIRKLNFNLNDNKKDINNFRKDIVNYFYKIKKELKKKLSHINPIELEFFNLRNDKIEYLDKTSVAEPTTKYHDAQKGMQKQVYRHPKTMKEHAIGLLNGHLDYFE